MSITRSTPLEKVIQKQLAGRLAEARDVHTVGDFLDFLPRRYIDANTAGRLAEFEREVDEIIGPDVKREWVTELPSYETPFDGELLEAMNGAILATDPDARTVPYMLSGGTDAKHFARLGIRCFGFAPLRLPPDLDFAALFHGVDERVPVDALTFGAQVLEHFLLHS